MQECTVTLHIDTEGKITVVSNEVAPSDNREPVMCEECGVNIHITDGVEIVTIWCDVCDRFLCSRCFRVGHERTCEGCWSNRPDNHDRPELAALATEILARKLRDEETFAKRGETEWWTRERAASAHASQLLLLAKAIAVLVDGASDETFDENADGYLERASDLLDEVQ